MSAYIKAILASVIPLVVAFNLYLQTGSINAPEIGLAVVALLNAILVAATRNGPAGLQKFTKFFVALLVPAATAIVYSLVSGSWNTAEWQTILTGLAVAVLVYFAGNQEAGAPLPNGSFARSRNI